MVHVSPLNSVRFSSADWQEYPHTVAVEKGFGRRLLDALVPWSLTQPERPRYHGADRMDTPDADTYCNRTREPVFYPGRVSSYTHTLDYFA